MTLPVLRAGLAGVVPFLLCGDALARPRAAAELAPIEIDREAAPTAPPAPKAPPAALMGVVAGQDARAGGAGTLGEALALEPGVAATGYAPGAASRPVLRGLDAARVRVQEGGLTTGDVSTLGDDHAVSSSPLAAERIDIVRGPAALRFGSQIVGGVVDVADRKIAETIAPGVRFTSFGALSSVDRGRDGAAELNAAGDRFALHAGWFGRERSDYRTPDGVQANSAARAASVSVGASYVFESGFLGAAFTQYDALYHIPGLDPAVRQTRIDLAQSRVAVRGAYRPSGALIDELRLWAGYSVYRHNELSRDDAGVDGVRATFKNREWETRVEARLTPVATPFGALTGVIGAHAGAARLGSSGEAGSLIAPAFTRTLALYALTRLALSSATRLEGGVRLDRWRIDGRPALFPGFVPPGEPLGYAAARAFTPISVSAAFAHDLVPGLTAALTGAVAQRAPQALELFARGAHDATGAFEIGDPALRLETARTIEASLRKSEGRLRFDLRGFATAYSGFIYRRDTGVRCGDDFATCGVETALRQTAFAQKAATFLGGEAKAVVDVAELGGGVVALEAQGDLVRARLGDGARVPRMPPARAGGGVSWRDARVLVRATALHAFAQRAAAPDETPTAGYTLLNAEVRYARPLDPARFGFSEIVVALVGANLLDARVRNSASFRKDEVLAPGRSARMSATLRF